MDSLLPKQEEIVRALTLYDRVAVKACHGVGKTFVAAKIVLQFASMYPGSQVITTAPTGRLVKKLLWEEIRAGHAASRYPLGGEMLTTEWKLGPKWFALGFSPQKDAGEQQAGGSQFQGFHAPYVLIVFDEATGIPPTLWDQVEGMLTGKFVRFLAIGNPTTKACRFFNCFTSKLWRTFTISCFDSPNLEANGITSLPLLLAEVERVKTMSLDEQHEHFGKYLCPRPEIVTLKWVVERAIEWGTNHPLFVSRATGEFPEDDQDAIVSLGQVQEAQCRSINGGGKRRSTGVDPAYSNMPGRDSSAIAIFHGESQTERQSFRGKDTGQLAGWLINRLGQLQTENPVEEDLVLVDSTGIGAGVYDRLREAHEMGVLHAIPVSIQFGVPAGLQWELKRDQDRAEDRYFNLKARIYGQLADDIGSRIKLLEDLVYQEELPTIRKEWDSRGRLKIESKDDYRERTGRKSPDDSDALGIANFGRTIPMPRTNSRPRVTSL